MVANTVENQIVALVARSEIRSSVINNFIRADRSDHIQIPGTANAGHVGAERLGDLHRERTHASRRTVNQDLVARLNLSLVAQALQRCQSRDIYRSGLLERDAVGFRDDTFLARGRILRESSTASAEHLVAGFELLDVPANRFNLTGHINAGSSDRHFE